MLDQLTTPLGVLDIALAPGDVTQMARVVEPALELIFEQVEHGAPVDAGGLHPDDRHGGALLEVVDQGPLGIPEKLFAAIGLLALSNGALINMIMASRLLYGMAQEGVMPRPFAKVLPGRRTPWTAILFTSSIAAVLVATGDLAALADTTVALLVVVFGVVNVSVLVLRRERVEHEHFVVWSVVPVIGVAISLALLTQIEAATYGRAAILVAVGVGLWIVNWLVVRNEPSTAG